MRVDVVSIFPQYLEPLKLSLIGKASDAQILDLRVHDLRDYTSDRHRTVDDSPYGGGAGMVMKPEPWALALEAINAVDALNAPSGVTADMVRLESGQSERARLEKEPQEDQHDGALSGQHQSESKPDGSATNQSITEQSKPTLVVPSPAGRRFDQAFAQELAGRSHLVFACGRYEGIDERVLEWAENSYEVVPLSLGDYVLNGGEVAALVVIEAVARLIPGVIGNPDSLVEESHADGLLEYPVYTKPASWRGKEVPEVLLSGNHAAIARWRKEQQLERTRQRRPDLLSQSEL